MKEIFRFTKEDHLRKVRCFIDGKKVERGLVIYEAPFFYLLQNVITGSRPEQPLNKPEAHGYKNSWYCQHLEEQKGPDSKGVTGILFLTSKSPNYIPFL